MKKKRKIGVLGGSFDPLHFGHLNMAIALLESRKLDQVVFCPARISPFKEVTPPIASDHRLAMVALGIQGIKEFSILDWEITRPGPSYTVETIQKLKTASEADLYLLLGEDQLAGLHRWHNVDQLFSLCTPLIASRETNATAALAVSPELQALIAQNRIKIPLMEISSTVVRERIKQKKMCSHLVPHLILDYIKQHRLYS